MGTGWLLAMVLLVVPMGAHAERETVVGVMRSDHPELSDPVPPDSSLTYEQVEGLVRAAVEAAGGLEGVVRPEHRWIVIKPNLVELKPSGSGVITDCRVVKAVTRMVHEIAPEARITIAEGSGGWLSPGHEEETGRNGVDGFEPTGYRALMTDPDLEGVNLDLFDLNFDESEKLVPVGGGHALDAYWIPKTVLECDVFINVPVLKVIRTIGMTVALKNMVGIAPGNKYGWGKDLGEPPGRGPALPHELGVIDEMIVDLATSRWWMRSWGWSGVRPRARRGVRTARKMVWAGIGCRCWRRIVMGTYGLWSTITGATGTRWRISMGRGGFLRNRSAGSAPFLQIVGGEYG